MRATLFKAAGLVVTMTLAACAALPPPFKASAQGPDAVSPQCDVLAVAVARLLNPHVHTKISLGTAPPMATRLDIESFSRPAFADEELVTAFDQRTPTSAVGLCRSLASQLSRHNAVVSPSPEPRTPYNSRLTAETAELRIGSPLVAPSGTAALVTVELQCTPSCGYSMTYLLHAVDSQWKIVAIRPEWQADATLRRGR